MPIPLLRDFAFAEPWFLLGLLALPLLALARGRKGPAPAVAFAPLHLLASLGSIARSRFGRFVAAFFYLGFAAAILGLARPQRINAYENQTASGIEITLAVDVSYSMSIEDFRIGGRTVNRLDAARHVITQFIEGRPSDRVGLVIFSGRPHAVAPLTLDHGWLQRTIESELRFRRPEELEQGTAIGTAVAASAKRLMNREAKSRIVVLITDGVQTTPGLSPAEAANLAATLGIKVYTIAIGTEGTHFVPLARSRMEQTFDLEVLRQIAETTGARSYLARDTDALERIFADIDALEKTEIVTQRIVEAKDYFSWCVGAALAFITLGLGLNATLLRGIP